MTDPFFCFFVQNEEKIRIVCLDVGDWDKTKKALNDVGPVDLLVNNAAVLDLSELREITEEKVDR